MLFLACDCETGGTGYKKQFGRLTRLLRQAEKDSSHTKGRYSLDNIAKNLLHRLHWLQHSIIDVSVDIDARNLSQAQEMKSISTETLKKFADLAHNYKLTETTIDPNNPEEITLWGLVKKSSAMELYNPLNMHSYSAAIGELLRNLYELRVNGKLPAHRNESYYAKSTVEYLHQLMEDPEHSIFGTFPARQYEKLLLDWGGSVPYDHVIFRGQVEKLLSDRGVVSQFNPEEVRTLAVELLNKRIYETDQEAVLAEHPNIAGLRQKVEVPGGVDKTDAAVWLVFQLNQRLQEEQVAHQKKAQESIGRGGAQTIGDILGFAMKRDIPISTGADVNGKIGFWSTKNQMKNALMYLACTRTALKDLRQYTESYLSGETTVPDWSSISGPCRSPILSRIKAYQESAAHYIRQLSETYEDFGVAPFVREYEKELAELTRLAVNGRIVGIAQA